MGSPEAVRLRREADIPYGESAEVGAAAAFLLSPGGSCITGRWWWTAASRML